MLQGMKMVTLKVPDDMHADWVAAAEGRSLGEYIRDCVNGQLADEAPAPAVRKQAPVVKGRARTGMCEHRISANGYCRHCD